MKNLNKDNLSFLAGGILLGLAISKGIEKVKEMIVKEKIEEVKEDLDKLEKHIEEVTN